MSLRDRNLRYTALKLIADLVKSAMDAEKNDHRDLLVANADDTGSRAWTVTIGGRKVAGITLAQRAAAPTIVDQSALIDAIADAHPDMLEHTVSLKPWAQKQILESIVDVTDDGAVTRDGEVLPGIEMSQPGEPYQSVRFAPGGKETLAEAIRGGELAELLEGTGLPMIEATR